MTPAAGWAEGWDLADAETEGWEGERVERYIADHAIDPTAPEAQPHRPKVSLATADHGELQNNVWRGIGEINANGAGPRYFRSASTPAELQLVQPTPFGESKLISLDASKARAHLTRDIFFTTIRGQYGEGPATPPAELLSSVTVAPAFELPSLRRLVTVPVFAADGRLLSKPGYDAAAGIYYAPAAWVAGLEVPENPTESEFTAAMEVIIDVLADFPFASPTDRAHAWALMLLPLVRELIAGPTPLHRIEAPDIGSGKSLLADVLLKPSTPDCAVISETREEEEWRKIIMGALRDGTGAIKIDNCRHLNSSVLASVLTAWPAWGGREIYGKGMTSYPNSCIYVATVNNPEWSPDMGRRSIRIRLDAKMERPFERTAFRHKELMTFIENRRQSVLGALLTVATWGLHHRQPAGAMKGSYEAWARVMGDLLAGLEIPGFLAEIEGDLSVKQDGMTQFVSAWWEAWGSKEMKSSQLLPIADEIEDLDVRGDNPKRRAISLGSLIGQKRDKLYIGNKQIHKARTMLGNVFWLEEQADE